MFVLVPKMVGFFQVFALINVQKIIEWEGTHFFLK